MKTPREVFLKGHRDQIPSLDQIREQVLASELASNCQIKSGILPVTERRENNQHFDERSSSVAVEKVVPAKGAQFADCRVVTHEATSKDRQAAHSTFLDALRSWLTLNRLTWSGFAAAWVAIVALNIAAETTGGARVIVRSEIESSDVQVRWQDHRAELALMLFDELSPDESATKKQNRVPGPRSGLPGFRRFSQTISTEHA